VNQLYYEKKSPYLQENDMSTSFQRKGHFRCGARSHPDGNQHPGGQSVYVIASTAKARVNETVPMKRSENTLTKVLSHNVGHGPVTVQLEGSEHVGWNEIPLAVTYKNIELGPVLRTFH
jgi:hypothetical protein